MKPCKYNLTLLALVFSWAIPYVAVAACDQELHDTYITMHANDFRLVDENGRPINNDTENIEFEQRKLDKDLNDDLHSIKARFAYLKPQIENISTYFYAREPLRSCLIKAFESRIKELTPTKTAKKPTNSGNDKANDDKKSLVYFPSDKKCLMHGVDSDGRETYTNMCSTTITFGYCHVYPKDKNDGTGCKSEPSSFSHSGYNYVTQGGGLEPGETHTKAYVYNRTQSTFLVACRSGRNPLIESFNSKTITATSKARMSCWAFSDNKKAVKN